MKIQCFASSSWQAEISACTLNVNPAMIVVCVRALPQREPFSRGLRLEFPALMAGVVRLDPWT